MTVKIRDKYCLQGWMRVGRCTRLHQKNIFPAMTVVWLMLLVNTANGGIIYLSSEQTILAETTAHGNQSITSDEAGWFDDSVQVQGTVTNAEGQKGALAAHASLTSLLSDDRIFGWGTASGYADRSTEVESTNADSRMSVTFEVDEDTPFTLSGEIHTTTHNQSVTGTVSGLRIVGDDGTPIFEALLTSDMSDHIDFTAGNTVYGILRRGVHTLEAFADGTGSKGESHCADFRFTLSTSSSVILPEPHGGLIALSALLFCSVAMRSQKCD